MTDNNPAYTLNYTGEDFDLDLNMQGTRMKPPHPCQSTKEVEPLKIKHDHTLTAKQVEFVNKELSNGSNTILIKKFITSNIPEETELENPYQKTLITGHENRMDKVTKSEALHK